VRSSHRNFLSNAIGGIQQLLLLLEVQSYLAGPDARWRPWTKALHQATALKTK